MGLTQEQVAERLRVERSTVARWEAGGTQPQPWLRPRLAELLEVSIDELDAWLASPTASGADAAMGAEDLEALSEQLTELAALYQRVPSTSLLSDASRCLAHIQRQKATTTSPRAGRVLGRLQAAASLLTGQLLWDASQRRDQRNPRLHFQAALHASRDAGDRELESQAYLRIGFIALYGEKDYRSGLRLALRAVEVSTDTNPSAAAFALLHAAEAQAYLKDATASEYSLSRAEVLRSGDAGRGSKDDCEWRQTVDRLSGSCYLSLGFPERAETRLRRAVQRGAAGEKSDAIALGNLAAALAQQRRIDEAASILHEAIDILEPTRGGGGLNVAFSVGRQLHGWSGLPEVRDVLDRLMSLVAA